jgi:hypothetical protein
MKLAFARLATSRCSGRSTNSECARVDCIDQIEMTLGEYEKIRSSPVRFAVLPDDQHVFPEVELLVERHRRYWVVVKIGEAGAEATALAGK